MKRIATEKWLKNGKMYENYNFNRLYINITLYIIYTHIKKKYISHGYLKILSSNHFRWYIT